MRAALFAGLVRDVLPSSVLLYPRLVLDDDAFNPYTVVIGVVRLNSISFFAWTFIGLDSEAYPFSSARGAIYSSQDDHSSGERLVP